MDALEVPNCYAYRFALFGKFGAPVYIDKDEKFLIWRDQLSGNAVHWVYAPPSICEIRLSPINNDFVNSM